VATFLLTWNPDGTGWASDDFEATAEAHANGRPYRASWSVAIRKSGITVGDRAFLLRQRHERGVVASGRFVSEIYTGQHWEDPSRLCTYADIDYDVLLPIDDRLRVDDLKQQVPGVAWDRLQGSGVIATPPSDHKLEQAWSTHTATTPYRTPGEYSSPTYEEGDVTRVEVNRYERDRGARAACIAHHGTTCVVCGFNFQKAYGELGRDFIHVHHLREISTLGANYQIDPVDDMRPLCANCHSMVHRSRPALQPAELKRRMKNASKP